MSPITISQIHIYPVKSLGGFSVDQTHLTATGAEDDRRWMVVTPQGDFLTQRKFPAMCLISVRLDSGLEATHPLTLNHPEGGTVQAARGGGPRRQVRVWNDTVEAEDCGEAVAGWLSTVLDKECRLVYMPAGSERAVPESEATVGFADAYPLLLCNTASLDDFNRYLPMPIGMNRFRPNLIVEGAEPWAEDSWKRLQVGQIELRVDSPCTRCIMPAVDPATGSKQAFVTDALNQHRRFGHETRFGQNVSYLNNGCLRVGDTIEVVA